MGNLWRSVLFDAVVLYPLVILGYLYSHLEAVMWVIGLNNIIAVVVSFILILIAPNLSIKTLDSLKLRGPHLVYAMSSTIVELAAFIWLGWYGLALLWLIMFGLLTFASFKGN